MNCFMRTVLKLHFDAVILQSNFQVDQKQLKAVSYIKTATCSTMFYIIIIIVNQLENRIMTHLSVDYVFMAEKPARPVVTV